MANPKHWLLSNARALAPDDQGRATGPWTALQTIASDVAVNGERLDATALSSRLAEQGFNLTGRRNNDAARKALAGASEHSLRDIGDHVGSARCRVTHDSLRLTRHETKVVMSKFAAMGA
jgi:hypothetical protein